MKQARLSLYSALQRPPKLVAGLTLIESLIVLVVLAGSIRLAVPSVEAMFTSIGLSSASNAILADMQLARSEALRRNRRVVLCKSPGASKCTGEGGWEQGWIVFQDENNNAIADDGEEVIAHHEALPFNLRLSGNANVAKYISYTSTGIAVMTNGRLQLGTLTLCRTSGGPTQSRLVSLNSVGRPRVKADSVEQCV